MPDSVVTQPLSRQTLYTAVYLRAEVFMRQCNQIDNGPLGWGGLGLCWCPGLCW